MNQPSYTIRAYQGSDEHQVIDLWNDSMPFDRINPTVFRTKVLLDLNFNPEGLFVASNGNQLVGFLLSISRQVPQFLDGLQPEKAWVTAFGVRPQDRNLGIGQALFNCALSRLADMGKEEVIIAPYTPNYFIPGIDIARYPETISFLQRRGWKIVSEPISMRVETTGFQISAEVLAREIDLREQDIAIRPVIPADLPELMSFISLNFGWDWVRHAQEYLLELFGAGSDQICFLVALHKDRIVGYCQQRRERFGPFGVDPALRSQGIGRVLLSRCLLEMLSKGFHSAWFLWTGRDAARLYSSVGFREVRQFAVMQKHIQRTSKV